MNERHIHANPLFSRIVGIDRVLGLAEAALKQASETTYPPYNVIKIGNEAYRIELALAGFAIEDLSIETKEKVLVVSGDRKDSAVEDASFLHRGIANRSFKREFQLADYVEVKGAALLNGILSIDLVREVPEAQKHRKIDITVSAKSSAAPESELEAAE